MTSTRAWRTGMGAVLLLSGCITAPREPAAPSGDSSDAAGRQMYGTCARLLRTSDMTFSDLPPAPPPPLPVATIPEPSPPVAITKAAQRVLEMRPDFRTCYQRALAKDRHIQGRVRVTIKVGADGHVTEVTGHGSSLPVETVDCVLYRASATQFDPPVGGKAIIAVPVTFVHGAPPPRTGN